MSYISADEAAKILQSHPNTIYKMCRNGKLPAIKVGKEWRIDNTQLADYSKGESAQVEKQNFDELALISRSNGHFLGIFTEKGSLEQFESTFLYDASLMENRRLFKGCWWQHPDDTRAYLGDGGLDVEGLESQGKLVIKNLSAEFENTGAIGAASAWLKATSDALQAGYDGLSGCGSPDFECCGSYPQLLEFEKSLDTMLRGQPVSGVCSYILDPAKPNAIARMLELISHHDQFLIHSKDSSLLAKPCN